MGGPYERGGGAMLGFVRFLLAIITVSLATASASAMSLEEFSVEFLKNPPGFTSRHAGGPLSVTGPVWVLTLDVNPPTITLGDGKSHNISCILSAAGKEKALSLSKGDTVTISG